MILSKASLETLRVAVVDSKIPLLGNIHVETSGRCVASNAKVLLAVDPVIPEVRKRLQAILPPSDPVTDSIDIPVSTIKEIVKNLPRDNKFGGLLEHVHLSVVGDDITFVTSDGRRRRTILGKRFTRGFIKYRDLLRRALGMVPAVRVEVNLKRLLGLLNAVNAVVGDRVGDSGVLLSVGSDGTLMLRGTSPRMGQSCVGVMKGLVVRDVVARVKRRPS